MAGKETWWVVQSPEGLNVLFNEEVQLNKVLKAVTPRSGLSEL